LLYDAPLATIHNVAERRQMQHYHKHDRTKYGLLKMMCRKVVFAHSYS